MKNVQIRKKEECIFCSIAEGDSISNRIMENDLVVAFYDIRPLSKGHLLVATKKHYKNLLEVKQDDWNAILPILLETAKEISSKYSPKGFNLVSNIGEEAFQSVEHFHIHLIPKYKKREGFVWPDCN